MKIKTLILLTCLALAGSCASDKGSGDAANAKQKQEEKNPEVGMTKEQVITLYGKTDNVQMSSDGEIWSYNLNMGEAFIPFNFGYRPRIRIIQFDKEGKVSSWRYSK